MTTKGSDRPFVSKGMICLAPITRNVLKLFDVLNFTIENKRLSRSVVISSNVEDAVLALVHFILENIPFNKQGGGDPFCLPAFHSWINIAVFFNINITVFKSLQKPYGEETTSLQHMAQKAFQKRE